MADKYKNKYRVQSHRRPNWDYSGDGMYFLTMVTQHRICHFGDIKNAKMILSDFGQITDDEWLKSFEIRAELFCDEYIIMPNHIHAIVVLKKLDWDSDGIVETHRRASLRDNNNIPIRKPKSISSFVAGFKSAVVSKINDYIDQNQLNIPKYNRHNHFFQPNYHDHIIRNQKSYELIKNYIINNPLYWEQDQLKS